MTSTTKRHRAPAVDFATIDDKDSGTQFLERYMFQAFGYGKWNVDERLQRSSPARALAKTYVKINPESCVSIIVLDVDHEDAFRVIQEAAYDDESIPVPTWVTINPHTGHAHAAWTLLVSYKTNNPKAVYVGNLIRSALTSRISGADPAYCMLTMRSPFSRGHETVWMNPEHLHFRDMLDILEVDPTKRRPEVLMTPDVGDTEGRNHYVFEATRVRMYTAHRRYETFDPFLAACVRTAMEINLATFPSRPLLLNEVRHIGKSIANWTWQNMHGNATGEFSPEQRAAFLAAQSARGERAWAALTPEQSSSRHRAIALSKHGDPEGARLAQAQTMVANGKTPQQVQAVAKYSASQSRRIVATQFPKQARIAARRAEVSRLRASGLTVAQIAARHQVSVGTIWSDIRTTSQR